MSTMNGKEQKLFMRLDHLLAQGIPIQTPHGNYLTCGSDETYSVLTRGGQVIQAKTQEAGIYFSSADDGTMHRVGDLLDTSAVVEHLREHFSKSDKLFEQWLLFLDDLKPDMEERDSEEDGIPGMYTPPEVGES